MHYSEGTVMPNLIVKLITGKIREAPLPFFIKPITNKVANMVDNGYADPEVKKNLTYLEEMLGKSPAGPYFCGATVTGADVMIYFVLEGAILGKSLTESVYPKLFKYVRTVQSLDSYKKAGERVSEASGEKFVPFSESGRNDSGGL
jgi:glutathione S-transferase